MTAHTFICGTAVFFLAIVAALLNCGCESCMSKTGPAANDGSILAAKSALSPNVLVITMDTTRADHIRCYGYDKIQTPNIDAVAGEGVLFEEAFSVQPVTLPSHASIFTGKYPYNHGIRDNNIFKLADENVTLAELLAQKGYLTTAFLASYILEHQFGLHQGFHYYNDRFIKPKQKGRLPVDRRASEVSLLAGDWLEEVEDDLEDHPFFLWLHYYDPHADYDPPHPYKTAYSNPYDGEIAYMDDWIGYFIDELKKRDKWDNTIVVVVADHGEGLGDYGERTHGMFIYRPTTRVPLIVRYPDKLPSGVRVEERVSTVDITPTILGILGIESDVDFDGKNLVPLIDRTASFRNRSIYSEVFIPRSFNWSELKGIRKGDRFYIEGPRPELLPLSPGKNETGNLVESEPERAGEMKDLLAKILDEARPARIEKVAVDENMIERLQALGYFVGGGQDEPDTGHGKILPDPKDRIALFNISQRANALSAKGMIDESIALLTLLVAQDPDNPRFLMELADQLTRKERYSEASKHLKHAVEIAPTDSRLHFLLGMCHKKWGKLDLAVVSLEAAIAHNPRHSLALFQLGLIHIEQEKWSEAQKSFLTAREIKPTDGAVANNLGFIAIKGNNDFDTGLPLIEEALRLSPKNPSILSSLGWAYFNAKEYRKAAEHLEAALRHVPDNRQFIEQLKSVYVAIGNTERLKTLEEREALLDKRL